MDRAALFDRLTRLGVAHRTVAHPPIMTVEEGRTFKASMPGGHSKNLFLRDKKGAFYFVTAHCDTQIDLVALGRRIGARGRLSFGKAEQLAQTLGVTPGSVTPFALFHAGAAALSAVIVDAAFEAFDPIWFHPLQNTASTAVSTPGLIAFIQDCGFEPQLMDFADLSRA